MTRTFDLALHRAKNMSRPRPPKITFTERSTEIDFNRNPMPMAGGGGLSSIQKRMNIGGQPHKLAYINSNEASLLKQLGGSGRPVNGIPAYVDMGEGMGGYGSEDAADTGGLSDTADAGLGMGSAEGWTDEEKDAAMQSAASLSLSQQGSGFDTMGFGTTGYNPDWRGGTWGVQDPETGKSLQDPGMLDIELDWKDVLGVALNPKLAAAKGLWGIITGAWKNIKGGMADRAALQDVLDNPYTSKESKAKAQEALDKFNKGYGAPDDLDYGTEESEEEKKIIAEEEEREKEEKVGMDRYFQVMRGKTPLGYTENEKRILARIYPPDHPIWKDINREREPIWPIIDPDPDPEPDPLPDPPVFPDPPDFWIDPPRLIPHDPDEPQMRYTMIDEEEEEVV